MSRRANITRHGANHAAGGSDPIPGLGGGGGAAAPLIIDYFDNSISSPNGMTPPDVNPPGSTTTSWNFIRWVEEANWSGYNSPQPWIGVDDVITGSDTYGADYNSRRILIPMQGTDTDFVAESGAALIKVEFMMALDSLVEGVTYDVIPYFNYTTDYGGTYANAFEVGVASGNYGWQSDFPVTYKDGHRPRAHLTWFQQLFGEGVYYSVAFQVTQAFSTPDDFISDPYCQCVITLLKNDAFEGERTA